MPKDVPSRLIRFDFPPGATPKEIATALRACYDRVWQEKAESPAPSRDEATRPGDGTDRIA